MAAWLDIEYFYHCQIEIIGGVMAVCGVVCYVYSGAAEKCHAGKVVGGKGGR